MFDKNYACLSKLLNTCLALALLLCRDAGPADFDEIELPDNHPFAVKKQLSEGEISKCGVVLF